MRTTASPPKLLLSFRRSVASAINLHQPRPRQLAMASSSSTGKRKPADAPISPPPLKRKLASGMTKSAVANFFKPASQKPKERVTWSERGPNDDTPATLLVARYDPEGAAEEEPDSRKKVAAFDLDSTLITTASGKKHATEATDWRWWDNSVPGRLKELYDEGYRVVILSNQGGITLHPDGKTKGPKINPQARVTSFKQKCNAVLSQLDFPLTLYAATGKDIYRKPRPGMWKELCEDWDIRDDVDLEKSIFVGDAGGRTSTTGGKRGATKELSKDFSCSDRNFAHNVGITYKTPEEFFLGEESRDFTREFDLAEFPTPQSPKSEDTPEVLFEKKNDKDIVMFCGPPGAGKSTFFWNYMKPLGYERINQDNLKTRDKCVKVAREQLQNGQSVVIDNTNAGTDVRAVWVDLAKTVGVPIRCVWFKTPMIVCQHNDAVRSLNSTLNPESRTSLPTLAFTGFKSRFKEPKIKEGFQDITEVDFRFRGTKDEHGVWARYWL